MRSRAALMLARLGHTQARIGEAVGVSAVSVCHWANGARQPDAAHRAELEARYNIPAAAWDEPPVRNVTAVTAARVAASKPVDVPPSHPPIGDGVLAKAAELEGMARELMMSLRDDPLSTPLEKAKVMSSVAVTRTHLAKLTGQYEQGKRLLSLPIWKRVEAALEAGLRGHPDAARAVANELQLLDDEAS